MYRGNADRVGYRFFTKSLPEITYFYNTFYKNNRKIIPKDIRLSPLSLAVWYMDDGSKSYKSCYFNSQYFDDSCQNNLMKMLAELKIIGRLNKDKKYKRIRITTQSTPYLMDIIKPYIISSMRYKIPV